MSHQEMLMLWRWQLSNMDPFRLQLMHPTELSPSMPTVYIMIPNVVSFCSQTIFNLIYYCNVCGNRRNFLFFIREHHRDLGPRSSSCWIRQFVWQALLACEEFMVQLLGQWWLCSDISGEQQLWCDTRSNLCSYVDCMCAINLNPISPIFFFFFVFL